MDRDLAFDIVARDRTQTAFDAAARRAKGLGGIMNMTASEIDRSSISMNRLTAQVDRYAAAAGRAAAANDNWRRRNLRFQLFDVGQMLALGQNPAMTLMQQGPQIAQLYAGQGGIRAAVTDLLGSFGRLGPLALGAAAVVGGALAGITHEINQTSSVAVSFGDVAKASFEVIASAAWDVLKPVVDAIAPWFATAWDIVVQGAKAAGNTVIGTFVGAIGAIRAAWETLPAAIGDATVSAMNRLLSTVQIALRNLLQNVNFAMASVAKMTKGTMFEFDAPRFDTKAMLGGLGSWNIDNPFEGKAAEAGQAASSAFMAGFKRDFLGEAFDAVRQEAVANALERVAAEAGKAGGAMKRAAMDAKDPWEGLRKVSTDVFDSMQAAGNKIGSTLSGLIKGTKSWNDALADVLLSIAQIGFQNIAFPNTGFGGLLKGILGGLFGFRAEGGPVDPWGQYLVGEKGPEILQMGARGGRVVSNAQALGRSAAPPPPPDVKVEQHFHIAGAVSSRDVQQLVQKGAASAVDEVKRHLPGWSVQLGRDGVLA